MFAWLVATCQEPCAALRSLDPRITVEPAARHLVRPPSAAKTGEWRSAVTARTRRPWSAARPGGGASGRCRGAAGAAAAPRRSSSDSAVSREIVSGSCRMWVQGSHHRSVSRWSS
jgi:hypothetical protein